MAEDPSGGEKTEDASGKKLSKAREKGQVGKSVELPSVAILLAAFLVLYAFVPVMYEKSLALLDDSFRFDQVPILTDTEAINLLFRYVQLLFVMTWPLLLAVFAAAFISSVIQVGFQISWEAIEFKFSKLNPISGLMNKLSLTSVVELFKSIFKLVIVFSVAYVVIKGELNNILRLYDHGVSFILLYIMKISFSIAIKTLLIILFLAILDYLYQKWKFAEDQKMTKQEVKDEQKQTEGDPQIKSRIRQLQTQAARQRMMAEVPEADVVVTNPTRLAVAVKYDGKVMESPMVVAKGAGAVAANIRQIAQEAGVPLVENKELARNLYSMVDVGMSVPTELFQAVAELLAYVYKLKGKNL